MYLDSSSSSQKPGDGRDAQGDGKVPRHSSRGAEGRGHRGQRGTLRETELLLRVGAG